MVFLISQENKNPTAMPIKDAPNRMEPECIDKGNWNEKNAVKTKYYKGSIHLSALNFCSTGNITATDLAKVRVQISQSLLFPRKRKSQTPFFPDTGKTVCCIAAIQFHSRPYTLK